MLIHQMRYAKVLPWLRADCDGSQARLTSTEYSMLYSTVVYRLAVQGQTMLFQQKGRQSGSGQLVSQ